MKRFCLTLALVIASFTSAAAQQASPPSPSFDAFLRELWPAAQARGISRATFDSAFAGVIPDPRVLAATKRQPEYNQPFGAYVTSAVSAWRIQTGVRKATEWNETFTRVEKEFAVERWPMLAIWALESSFGADKDKWDVFRSIGTLAQAGYRDPYFRDELINALQILQEGHITRREMLGSWAGAMGQTQFMPKNFLDFAIDYSGDGRKDIWTTIPDVLGSTGNYLHHGGWKYGLPWGVEVNVPRGFDYRRSRGTFQEWAQLGLRRPDGAALPAPDEKAVLFFPSGATGPAFLVTSNYEVLKEYNNADTYAIAIGHLADRLHGGKPIQAAWPQNVRQLSREERIALQKKLASLGYDVKDFAGHIDFDLRDNVREQQVKFEMVPDGNPTAALLDHLGIKMR